MLSRIKKELSLLESSSHDGIYIWPPSDNLLLLHVDLIGPKESPYYNGVFKLIINIPEQYPNQPPSIKFVTKVYHPNIDNGGRICINALKMPPAGVWSPSLNIATVLVNIRILLSEPNPDDGLMEEITRQFRQNRDLFNKTASEWTKLYAISETISISAVSNTIKSPMKTITNTDNKENHSVVINKEEAIIAEDIKETTQTIESVTEINPPIAPPRIMKSLLSKRKIQI